ncbi:hypothetical protein ASPCAL13349 [Aspergillus calidoustus]|uniref:FAD/NAD(P)-binding domain-containing protein n=1 Tax=Aspergillus calidoustus TaxID=454130 RepID=A0A0U5GCY9_ASPCI|nr:hypothetical protein ASPCAL13349 [Aspergillus calidoustus]
MPSKSVDLLIVGAGVHGLIMAKTYLEVHPSATLLVVDESQSVGGTWARERLYPGLKTNNVFGSYELSDFPMDASRYGVEGTGHIPGQVVHSYLCDVADHFGLTSWIVLNTRVIATALLDDGSWKASLQTVDRDEYAVEEIHAAKLVLATGLTSKPHIPQIAGSDTFGRPILHSKQLKAQAQRLAESKTVVVVGGNKSAWDVCYTAARAGSRVHMVIRPSGGGPSYLWPRRFSLGTFEASLAKLSTMRLFTLFDPAVALVSTGPFTWAKRFLHQTFMGQWICRWFWTYLDGTIKRINEYQTHPELQKLEPWTTPFWMGNSLSIHNYETSWFDLVREGRINVHITDLESLSPGNVHLADGTTLDADALVLCTGWTTDLPVKVDVDRVDEKEERHSRGALYAKVPYLSYIPRRTSNAPTIQKRVASADDAAESDSAVPLLYRDMIPAEEKYLLSKNLAFIGMSVSIHAVLVAQAQALWITGFLSDSIPHLRAENLNHGQFRNKAILDRIYGQLRRPRDTGGLAGRHADLVFDSLPYVDGLLGDMGLPCRRKKNWWRELVEPYCLEDYRGLVREWMGLGGIDLTK